MFIGCDEMGQDEVKEMLKKYKGRKFTVNELNTILPECREAIAISCRKLRQSNQVSYDYVKIQRTKRGQYIYWVEDEDEN